MVKRRKIALFYSYNEDWIGGTYYIQNLISALKHLPADRQPALRLICNTYEEYKSILNLNYPYITWAPLLLESSPPSFFCRIYNKACSLLGQPEKYVYKLYQDIGDATFVFPSSPGLVTKNAEQIFWIPDFQEYYFPEYFTPKMRMERLQYHQYIFDSHSKIIFSSAVAMNDFNRHFGRSNGKQMVVHFAVTHSHTYRSLDVSSLFIKYDIKRPYFIVPNQMWIHKNHITVLKALSALIDRSFNDFLFIFTGKEEDYRNPDHRAMLHAYVAENKLAPYARFLGFIDRDEQLKLIQESIAVIQPSLFEGWSTVVEDAKAINKYLVLSDIPVHREQVTSNVSFFSPENHVDLADILVSIMRHKFHLSSTSYADNVYNFADSFMKIVEHKS
jgi:hypothetical protein